MGADEVPPKKYDQEFFLALAAKGKDAWNAWWRDPANKDLCATIAGIDFSEAPRDTVNFEGFEFGDKVDFSRCKWRGVERKETLGNVPAFKPGSARFTGAAFGYRTNFTGAAFGDCADFANAAFGDFVNFTNAVFGNWATFYNAAFGQQVNFTGAAFGDAADFRGAAFGMSAEFTNAAFGDAADFADATFDDGPTFTGAAFGGSAAFRCASFDRYATLTSASFRKDAFFTGAAFGHEANFSQTTFKGRVEFAAMSKKQWTSDIARTHEIGTVAFAALKQRHSESRTRCGSGPGRFLRISFANARFDGEAIFSGRTFEGTADLTEARFYYPADFDAVTNAARIDFTGAHIGFARQGKRHWTKDSRVPVRLRAFRKIAEETKNHDLERDLYIEERKAERGVYRHQLVEDLKKEPWKNWPRNAARLVAHLLWIAVMGVYWALADYGRSFVRPTAWLVASGFFFYWSYGKILTPLMPKAGPLADKYEHAVGMLALGNAVPFVGPLTIEGEVKKFLFCAGDANCLPIPPEGFQFLLIAQNLLSIILVFSSASRCAIISGSSEAVSAPLRQHQLSAWKIASKSRAPCSTRTISIPSASTK